MGFPVLTRPPGQKQPLIVIMESSSGKQLLAVPEVQPVAMRPKRLTKCRFVISKRADYIKHKDKNIVYNKFNVRDRVIYMTPTSYVPIGPHRIIDEETYTKLVASIMKIDATLCECDSQGGFEILEKLGKLLHMSALKVMELLEKLLDTLLKVVAVTVKPEEIEAPEDNSDIDYDSNGPSFGFLVTLLESATGEGNVVENLIKNIGKSVLNKIAWIVDFICNIFSCKRPSFVLERFAKISRIDIRPARDHKTCQAELVNKTFNGCFPGSIAQNLGAVAYYRGYEGCQQHLVKSNLVIAGPVNSVMQVYHINGHVWYPKELRDVRRNVSDGKVVLAMTFTAALWATEHKAYFTDAEPTHTLAQIQLTEIANLTKYSIEVEHKFELTPIKSIVVEKKTTHEELFESSSLNTPAVIQKAADIEVVTTPVRTAEELKQAVQNKMNAKIQEEELERKRLAEEYKQSELNKQKEAEELAEHQRIMKLAEERIKFNKEQAAKLELLRVETEKKKQEIKEQEEQAKIEEAQKLKQIENLALQSLIKNESEAKSNAEAEFNKVMSLFTEKEEEPIKEKATEVDITKASDKIPTLKELAQQRLTKLKADREAEEPKPKRVWVKKEVAQAKPQEQAESTGKISIKEIKEKKPLSEEDKSKLSNHFNKVKPAMTFADKLKAAKPNPTVEGKPQVKIGMSQPVWRKKVTTPIADEMETQGSFTSEHTILLNFEVKPGFLEELEKQFPRAKNNKLERTLTETEGKTKLIGFSRTSLKQIKRVAINFRKAQPIKTAVKKETKKEKLQKKKSEQQQQTTERAEKKQRQTAPVKSVKVEQQEAYNPLALSKNLRKGDQNALLSYSNTNKNYFIGTMQAGKLATSILQEYHETGNFSYPEMTIPEVLTLLSSLYSYYPNMRGSSCKFTNNLVVIPAFNQVFSIFKDVIDVDGTDKSYERYIPEGITGPPKKSNNLCLFEAVCRQMQIMRKDTYEQDLKEMLVRMKKNKNIWHRFTSGRKLPVTEFLTTIAIQNNFNVFIASTGTKQCFLIPSASAHNPLCMGLMVGRHHTNILNLKPTHILYLKGLFSVKSPMKFDGVVGSLLEKVFPNVAGLDEESRTTFIKSSEIAQRITGTTTYVLTHENMNVVEWHKQKQRCQIDKQTSIEKKRCCAHNSCWLSWFARQIRLPRNAKWATKMDIDGKVNLIKKICKEGLIYHHLIPKSKVLETKFKEYDPENYSLLLTAIDDLTNVDDITIYHYAVLADKLEERAREIVKTLHEERKDEAEIIVDEDVVGEGEILEEDPEDVDEPEEPHNWNVEHWVPINIVIGADHQDPTANEFNLADKLAQISFKSGVSLPNFSWCRKCTAFKSYEVDREEYIPDKDIRTVMANFNKRPIKKDVKVTIRFATSTGVYADLQPTFEHEFYTRLSTCVIKKISILENYTNSLIIYSLTCYQETRDMASAIRSLSNVPASIINSNDRELISNSKAMASYFLMATINTTPTLRLFRLAPM